MLVAVLVLAVIAAALAAVLVMVRGAAARDREAAAATEVALTTERDALRAERDELTSARDDLQRELGAARERIGTLEGELDQGRQERQRLDGDLAATRRVVSERETELEAAAARTAELEADLAEAKATIERAEAAAVAATARTSGIVLGELEEDGARPQTLWNLELARSERTWRTSVATNPEADQSPFVATDDPARLAVEIEASALRENVGASVDVEWTAGPVDDPTRRHLVVRVAQELLEAAARSPEPSTLRVEDDDGQISLSLAAIEGGDVPANIIPPQISSDLLDFRQDGRQITVSAG